MVLDKIKKANDVQELSQEELQTLAEEVRAFLIEHLSRTGGHLASNLGVVELTIALHRVLHFPGDRLIWDVGHQCYTHKILTGRKEEFEHLRQAGGMSGFPKRAESPCDSFDTGHSSTSISAGLGYVHARDLQGEDYRVISVIGDGALTGGMAYEALNNAAELKKNFVIVLNDNNMSISNNVGGMSAYLGNLRTAASYADLKLNVTNALKRIPRVGGGMVQAIHKTKSSIKQFVIPGMLFENMGLTYLGPVDGHNISQMTRIFQDAFRVEGPVLVHVLTRKGMGYEPAMRHPARFHGTAPFEIETGIPAKKTRPAYTDIFSTVMRKFGDRDEKVVAVTAAMPTGTGLNRFAHMFPQRFFDVGIAEEHAVTFAAGLALGGLKPVVAVYSSFLQRAVDQVLHDVCMQNLHVVFAIDRAGLVGSDGETHQGIFDLSYLSSIPNMHIMAPKNKWELSDMLKFAVEFDGPVALRYPRGEAYDGLKDFRRPIVYGKSEVIYEEEDIALLAVGSMVKTAEQVRRNLKGIGYSCTLVNGRFIKPVDTDILEELAKDHRLIVTMEENVRSGGFGERVQDYIVDRELPVHVLEITLPDEYVEHGNASLLYEEVGIDADSVTKRIIEKYITIKQG